MKAKSTALSNRFARLATALACIFCLAAVARADVILNGNGELGNGDDLVALDTVGTFNYDVWSFSADAGGDVTIKMTTSGFLPYLGLFNPGDLLGLPMAGGQVLWEDVPNAYLIALATDGTDTTMVEIMATLPGPGVYEIAATTSKYNEDGALDFGDIGGDGSYQLMVTGAGISGLNTVNAFAPAPIAVLCLAVSAILVRGRKSRT